MPRTSPRGFLTLLPEDPDASAERLQKELVGAARPRSAGVVITDTFGRPWREGVVDVAIGCAGLPPLLDLRGTTDDHGAVLETTVVALADAVAAASGLVMTKTARVPAALVRGLDAMIGDAPPEPARSLVRTPADDLFRESVAGRGRGAIRAGLRPGRRASRSLLEDAIAAASTVPPSARLRLRRGRLHRRAAPAARRRAQAPDDALRSAPALIVPCVAAASSAPRCARPSSPPAPRSGSLGSPSRAGSRVVLGPGPRARRRIGASCAHARSGSRPIGIVAVGPMPEGGA